MSQVPLWRKLVSGVLAIVAAAGLASAAGSQIGIVAIPILLLLGSSGAVHVPKLGPQILARAIWWANLSLGVVLTMIGSSSERGAGVVMALGCGLALLAIGRKGLAEATESAGYAPAAFRGSLLLLMVFALADAQTFVLFAIISLSNHSKLGGAGPALLIAGVLYVVGFVGLYRLALWGALLNVATSALALLLLLVVGDEIDSSMRVFLMVVTAGHCVAATPMLVALIGKRTLPSLPARMRTVVTDGAVVLLVLLSVTMFALH